MMDADVIKTKIEITWQDTSAYWKDNYASRYNTAVIVELKNTLECIKNASEQLSESIYVALVELDEFND